MCGVTSVNNAIASVSAPGGSPFQMPVEFAVAAYRFGHSLIRNGYILNSSLPASASTLKGIFDFIRAPLLPLFSNWAVDFNMFFNTSHPVGTSFNNARKIDSLLANGLESILEAPGLWRFSPRATCAADSPSGCPAGRRQRPRWAFPR
jgi:hypothetical protein